MTRDERVSVGLQRPPVSGERPGAIVLRVDVLSTAQVDVPLFGAGAPLL
jgi:hypothetical protein